MRVCNDEVLSRSARGALRLSRGVIGARDRALDAPSRPTTETGFHGGFVLMSVLRSIRRDIGAILERDPAARNSLEVVLAYPGFHARELHRLAHTLHRRNVPVLPRIISNVSRFVTGIEIHPGARIGDGLFIDHGMGVVIGETAEIGEDCNLLQGVTLGGTSLHRTKRHPTLGNRVTVGAGAKLIGAVEIGDNARIGAGSVVVTNVPANATVVGVPGHIVAYHDPGSDTITKLPDPEWDRIDALERHIERMEQSIQMLRDKLQELGERVPAHPADEGEPAHVHRLRSVPDDRDDPAGAANREAARG
jgi:serine O-acetyltransferase